MAIYLNDVSRTFGEYLLIPGLTTKECIPANVFIENATCEIQVWREIRY